VNDPEWAWGRMFERLTQHYQNPTSTSDL
jgi:hypothetical protein